MAANVRRLRYGRSNLAHCAFGLRIYRKVVPPYYTPYSFLRGNSRDSNQNDMASIRYSQSQPPTAPAFPFDRSAMKPKTTRQACQAVPFRIMGGMGLEPSTFTIAKLETGLEPLIAKIMSVWINFYTQIIQFTPVFEATHRQKPFDGHVKRLFWN